MTTAKMKFLLGYKCENCYLVRVNEPLGGGSQPGGSFPDRGGMSKFLASGGRTPLSHPSRGHPVAPPKKYQEFRTPPPPWLSPSRCRWKLKVPQDPIKLFIYLRGRRIPRICTLSNLTLFALAKKVSQIWIFPWDLDAFTKFKFKTVFMKPFKCLNCEFF